MCGRPTVARRDRAPPVQQIVEESVSRSIQWAPSPPLQTTSTPEVGRSKYTTDGEHQPHTPTLYIPAPFTKPAPILVCPTPPPNPSRLNHLSACLFTPPDIHAN